MSGGSADLLVLIIVGLVVGAALVQKQRQAGPKLNHQGRDLTVGTSVTDTGTHVAYDASVIQSYANVLYSQAKTVVMVHVVLGAAIGGGSGLLAGQAISNAWMFGILIGAVIGYAIGSPKANALRLQAQLALCQVSIEKSTRRESGR